MEDIPEVDIDEGRFKYILIKLTDANKQTKYIVRGYAWADYHGIIRISHWHSLYLLIN